MPLTDYRRKRQFDRTPEPGAGPGQQTGAVYCVQRHDARRLHYDLRLQHKGVLLSWAVPQGPGLDPSLKRLAVQVEDHPTDYASFEGVIPAGNYGAGSVMLWDSGTWQPLKGVPIDEQLERGDLKFRLSGRKLRKPAEIEADRGISPMAARACLRRRRARHHVTFGVSGFGAVRALVAALARSVERLLDVTRGTTLAAIVAVETHSAANGPAL